MLPNGHYNFILIYTPIRLFILVIILLSSNKLAQIAMFLTYLVYFYKSKVNINNPQIFARYSRKLFKISIAMGATVGLSTFIWIPIAFDLPYLAIFEITGTISFFIQQAVIMTSFLSIKRMTNFCRAYLIGQKSTQT